MKHIKLLIYTVVALLFIDFVVAPTTAGAQGYIQLLNGKERRFTKAEIKGIFINYEPESKPGKSKKLNRFDAFSLNYDDGREEVLYKPDTSYDDEPTIEEVSDYVQGEKFAIKYYSDHPRYPASQLYFGFYSGFFSSLLGFYGAAAIPVYAIGVDRFGPDQPTDNLDQWNDSPSFVSGYEKVMRNKKVKNSLIGGAIGFTVGITTLAVIFND
jgi:hypothetical protein